MIVVVSLAIGRCRSDSVHRRPILGTAGVYIVVAAALAAYGLNSGFGEGTRKITPLSGPAFRIPNKHVLLLDNYCLSFANLFHSMYVWLLSTALRSCGSGYSATTATLIAPIIVEVPFTTLSIILPFILVGIGVDDMVSS